MVDKKILKRIEEELDLNLFSKRQAIDILANDLAKNTKDNPDKAKHLFFVLQKRFDDYISFDAHPPQEICIPYLTSCLKIIQIAPPRENREIIEIVETVISKYNFPPEALPNLARLLDKLGRAAFFNHDAQKAIQYFLETDKIANQLNDKTINYGRFNSLGNVFQALGRNDKAIDYFHKSIQLGLQFNKTDNLTSSHNNLGNIYYHYQNYTKASEHLEISLSYFSKNDFSPHKAGALNTLASIYGDMENYQKSNQIFSLLCNDHYKKYTPDFYIIAHTNLCGSALMNNDITGAEKYLLEVEDLVEDSGQTFPIETVYFFYQRALMNKAKQNIDLALADFRKGLSIAEEHKINEEVAEINYALAEVYLNKQDYETAKILTQKTLSIWKELRLENKIATVYKLLAKIEESRSRYKQALQNHKKYADGLIQHLQQQLKINKKEKQEIKKKVKKEFYFKSANNLISEELTKLVKHKFIGVSQAMKDLTNKLLMASEHPDVNVLILGESGVGKEIAARIIHYNSPRKQNNMFSVNSSAFPETLVESSFYGYEKNAFTGAEKLHIGYFEACKGGSVFFDEVGDMSYPIQSKLIRVLEEKVINRVGSVKNIEVDFRMISATNKNINKLAQNSEFRFDLLSRINTIEINIPPLRERTEDIPILTEHFLQSTAEKFNQPLPVLINGALDLLISYHFPGNIRELKSIIEKTMILNPGVKKITPEIIKSSITDEKRKIEIDLTNLNLHENENKLIITAMKKADNVQKNAAKLLGISPYALNRKLKKMKEESSN